MENVEKGVDHIGTDCMIFLKRFGQVESRLFPWARAVTTLTLRFTSSTMHLGSGMNRIDRIEMGM